MAHQGTAPHPGVLLRRHVLPALNMSVSEAARQLDVARQTLHRILAGSAAITPDMAKRLEKFCGVSAAFWLRRQRQHELGRLEDEMACIVMRIPAHSLPLKVLRQIGAADGN